MDSGGEEWVEVRELLASITDFIYPSIVDNDVAIENDFPEKVLIFGQQDKLRQVFLNIIMNSLDALKEKSSPRCIKLHGEVSDRMIRIYITNNGPMIPQETLKTIFEPFYTTKELGTGIGLYVCQKIIQNHLGNISCRSDDHETTFTVHLPVREQSEAVN
ncbi:MAG: HAMP domain-containing sensor histidine kinase [Anaerobacillus sp.]